MSSVIVLKPYHFNWDLNQNYFARAKITNVIVHARTKLL